MDIKSVIMKSFKIRPQYSLTNNFCTKIYDINEVTTGEKFDDIRNVSRLSEGAYMKVVKKDFHREYNETHDYNFYMRDNLRKYFGHHGLQSGINPGIVWPTKQELEDQLEKERLFYPSLETLIENEKQKKKKHEEEKKAVFKQVEENMKSLDKWKKELFEKIAAKRREAAEKQAKRDKLIAEVQAIVGFGVDPKDSRFKKALEEKEKEERKAMRKEMKKKQEEKMMLGLKDISEK